MTPELKALIEKALGWRSGGVHQQHLADAIDAYEKSLTTPPDGLPEAPSGKKWVRVDAMGAFDLNDGDRLRVTFDHQYYKAENIGAFDKGYGVGQGDVWRLVDDPEADSLERLWTEIDMEGRPTTFCLDSWAARLRKLIDATEKQQ